MNNVYENVTVALETYPLAPQMTLSEDAPLAPPIEASLGLHNKGAITVFYSFDGVKDHGELVPSTASHAKFFDKRPYRSVWLRLESAGTADVACEGWSL